MASGDSGIAHRPKARTAKLVPALVLLVGRVGPNQSIERGQIRVSKSDVDSGRLPAGSDATCSAGSSGDL